jgi:hypothetical protein
VEDLTCPEVALGTTVGVSVPRKLQCTDAVLPADATATEAP